LEFSTRSQKGMFFGAKFTFPLKKLDLNIKHRINKKIQKICQNYDNQRLLEQIVKIQKKIQINTKKP